MRDEEDDEEAVMKLIEATRLAAALHAEPLFHMSLGSKELFHSNLIAWLIDKYPDEVGACFASWTVAAPGRPRGSTERETSDLDIVIQLAASEAIVIENKAFSMPDERQLDRYASGPVKNRQGKPALVLLSLSNPRWTSDQHVGPDGTWQRRGYDALRAVLLPAIDPVRRRNAYDGDTLEHYCALLALLVELADLVDVARDDEPVALDPSIAAALAPARVDDVAEKMRMYQIGGRLRQALAKTPDVGIKSDFSNGTPLIEAFVPLRATDRIGWQYQDGQFRIALILDSMKSPGTSRTAREAYALEHYAAWLDLSRVEARLAPTRTVARRVDLNGFSPDFVHRYCVPINLTVGRLLDVGTECVLAAAAFAASVHPHASPGPPARGVP